MLALLLAPHPAQAQTSFDCAQATRVVDRIICGWGPLNSADRALAARYQAALAAAPSDAARGALREDQRRWLKDRDQRCVARITLEQMRDPANPAFHDATRCMTQAYAQRIVALQDRATPALVPIATEALPRSALRAVQTHPPQPDATDTWEAASMSPDETLLGVIGGGQVWLYRRDDQRLFAVTPPPERDAAFDRAAVSSLEGMRWDSDNSLYAWARMYNGSRQAFRATRDGRAGAVETVPTRWPDERDDSSDRYQIPDPDNARDAIGNARFTVWLQNRGHGSFDLMLGTAADAAGGDEPAVLVHGGGELDSFQFDAAGSRAFYGSDTGIVAHDLASGTIRRIAGTRRGDAALDFSSRSQWLAFRRHGRCDAKDVGAPGGALQAANLCLVRLPRP